MCLCLCVIIDSFPFLSFLSFLLSDKIVEKSREQKKFDNYIHSSAYARIRIHKLTLDMLIFESPHAFVSFALVTLSRLSPFFLRFARDFCLFLSHLASIMFLLAWPHAENVILPACSTNDIINRAEKMVYHLCRGGKFYSARSSEKKTR